MNNFTPEQALAEAWYIQFTLCFHSRFNFNSAWEFFKEQVEFTDYEN